VVRIKKYLSFVTIEKFDLENLRIVIYRDCKRDVASRDGRDRDRRNRDAHATIETRRRRSKKRHKTYRLETFETETKSIPVKIETRPRRHIM
jgi:hypothetical protein